MTTDQYNQAELDLSILMDRIVSLVYPNSVVNISGLQQMIADVSPNAYPVTSEGLGPSILRTDIVQNPTIPIDYYNIYLPNPAPDDPDNINSAYETTVAGIYPADYVYTTTPVKHLTVGRAPVDQRWEIIMDSQSEYCANIRSKLEWSV